MRDDAGERILSEIESTIGVRPASCPWQAFRDPLVVGVMNRFGWYRAQQLGARVGGPIPAPLAAGIEAFESALNRTTAHDSEKRREQEREQRKREQQRPDVRPPPRRRR